MAQLDEAPRSFFFFPLQLPTSAEGEGGVAAEERLLVVSVGLRKSFKYR